MMATTYLDEIIAHHRARAARDTRDWRERVDAMRYEGHSFLDALADPELPHVAVIAEVKRRSPSKGWLATDLDAVKLGALYQLAGARAISVLTDEAYFSGSREDLAGVVSAVSVPVLRKDFTVAANDVVDAVQMGAAAVLLIVAALDDEELLALLEVAALCGLDALVEVHDRAEARRALTHGARLIGINQRNLRTFVVDPEHAASVIDTLPDNVVTVCESGLRTRADVEQAARAGFDAVLVGETFVSAPDIEATVASFASVEKSRRG